MTTSSPLTAAPSQLQAVADAITAIIRDVCELPDRSSPDDWPEAMLVTPDELELIILRHLATQAVSEPPAGVAASLAAMHSNKDKARAFEWLRGLATTSRSPEPSKPHTESSLHLVKQLRSRSCDR